MRCDKSVFIILLDSDRSTSMGPSVQGRVLGASGLLQVLVEAGILNTGLNTRTKWQGHMLKLKYFPLDKGASPDKFVNRF
ncbi:hypothetical protein DPMN_071741 [Dreissena polymorpha]|uniref:Uncharacterized protein n=1 Tax=Dreissena polymorpha TaxID=45954 RepID=A0A9D3Z3H4_DREPO|nr:hypothetical protein DPMN_071741 [Dreissena polymorpha]